MAQDGEIPPMASPTYGRILNLVQQAYGSIREVKEFMTAKAPYIYIHTLAVLVHFNNIINAINFGMTLGTTVATLQQQQAMEKDFTKKSARSVQALIMAFFISLIA